MANRVQIILEMLNKSDKAMADVQRDVRAITERLDAMAATADRTLQRIETKAAGASQGFLGLGHGISAVAGKFVMLEMAVRRVARLVDTLFIDFNATLETAGLGIATSYLTAGRYIDQATGKALEGQAALAAAQEDSARMVERLQVANFQTIATLDQLIRAYQEALPVAMSKGFNRDQVERFTLAMVQAAGAIGLNLDQLGEETRSILTGTINPRTSRIATVLGLTNADVAQFKGNANGLFDFVMQKLSAYQLAGFESQKTWAGVWSNSLDLFKQLAAKVGEPVFEGLKRDLQAIVDQIVTVDAKTGKIEWNKAFLDDLNQMKEIVGDLYTKVSRLAGLVAKVGGELFRMSGGLEKTLPADDKLLGIPVRDLVASALGRVQGHSTYQADLHRYLGIGPPKVEIPPGLVPKTGKTSHVPNPPAEDPEALAAARSRRDVLERLEMELTARQGSELDKRLAAVDRWVLSERRALEKAGLEKAEIEQRMTGVVRAGEAEKSQIRQEYGRRQAEQLGRFEQELSDMQADELGKRLSRVDRWLADQLKLLQEAGLDAAAMEERTVAATAAAEAEKTKIRKEHARKLAEQLTRFEQGISELQDGELTKRLARVDRWLTDQLKLLEEAGLDAAAIEQRTVAATRAAEAEKAKIRRAAATAAREDAINAALAEIALGQRQRTVGREDAARQRVALQRELLELQQRHLEQLDKLADPDGWYAQQDAINATREALINLEDELQRLTGTLTEGLQRGLRDWLDGVNTTFEDGQQLAVDAAGGMQGAFESLLFDAQRGKLQELGDYWDMFLQTVQRSFAQILSQQAVAWIMRTLGLAKEQNNAADATALGTTAALTGVLAAQTGVVSTLTAAYWALAAAKAAAGAMGGMGGGAGAAIPTVTAHTGGLILHDGGPVKLVPRFHVGGLAADEVPAILQTGERVLSREQNRTFEKLAALLDRLGEGDGSHGPQVVNHYNISALDGPSVARLLYQNREAVAGANAMAGRDNHPSRRGR